ncbi:Uncharacterized protein Rs2_05081 [Raphanus sativus]|uniref:Uncharacterized protein LOC108840469 n=1 Tax=Raphanus sativus TaxID=3726 RepID=A0A6J0M8H1_RAPSA|nr:uncharacterized protein LOC108840469 [Raphanus sativus]KAJ4910460.1 Uncharacterized protein Rs2_05081 [Raphanus sativus]
MASSVLSLGKAFKAAATRKVFVAAKKRCDASVGCGESMCKFMEACERQKANFASGVKQTSPLQFTDTRQACEAFSETFTGFFVGVGFLVSGFAYNQVVRAYDNRQTSQKIHVLNLSVSKCKEDIGDLKEVVEECEREREKEKMEKKAKKEKKEMEKKKKEEKEKKKN